MGDDGGGCSGGGDSGGGGFSSGGGGFDSGGGGFDCGGGGGMDYGGGYSTTMGGDSYGYHSNDIGHHGMGQHHGGIVVGGHMGHVISRPGQPVGVVTQTGYPLTGVTTQGNMTYVGGATPNIVHQPGRQMQQAQRSRMIVCVIVGICFVVFVLAIVLPVIFTVVIANT